MDDRWSETMPAVRAACEEANNERDEDPSSPPKQMRLRVIPYFFHFIQLQYFILFGISLIPSHSSPLPNIDVCFCLEQGGRFGQG